MNRNFRLQRLLATVLLGLALTGCAAMRPEPPEIQLAGLTVNDLSLSHANFLATLSLYNPNPTPLDVKGLEFSLFLADIRVARGVTAKAFSLPAEQTGQASLRLSTSFLELLRLTQQLQGRMEVPFRIAGGVKIGGPGFLVTTVPIASEGVIPLGGVLGQLFADPEQFWRQPDRLAPEGSAGASPGNPQGR